MKYLHIFMIIILLAIAGYSLQSPDWTVWLIVYGFAIFSTILAYFDNYKLVPLLAGTGIMIYYLFQINPTAGANWLDSEMGRRAIGLIVAIIWLTVLSIIGFTKFLRERQQSH